MSRPFSYNDDNFTVIDNMLFVHFLDMETRKPLDPVVQVPDEIYKRMCSYSNVAIISPLLEEVPGSSVGITIVMNDNKPYIAFNSNRAATSIIRYHYCIYFLKDI